MFFLILDSFLLGAIGSGLVILGYSIGLYLGARKRAKDRVTKINRPQGENSWRLRYRIAGKRHTKSVRGARRPTPNGRSASS